jgi:membrane-associated phospholipid phosphatase
LPSPVATMSSLETEARQLVSGLRFSVPTVLLYGYFTYMTVEVLLFPLSIRERAVVVILNLAACATLLVLERNAASQRSRFLAVVRDWLPCILILVAYREAGMLFVPDPSHRLDYVFVRWDELILNNSWVTGALAVGSPWLQRYLEFSYFLCYPVVPLGVATLYLTRSDVAPDLSPAHAGLKGRARRSYHDSAIEHYWTAVLIAALSCYVLFPLFPLTPPRELFHDLPGPGGASGLRGLNHWLLNRYAVGASLFPSGHVASATAAALVIRRYSSRAGLVFLLVAASIAMATIYGRYHYAADALAGAVVGVLAYLASYLRTGCVQPKSA